MRPTTHVLLRTAALAVSAAAIATVYACGCTDIGCAGAITIHVTARDGTLPPTFSGSIAVDGHTFAFACPDVGLEEKCTPGQVVVPLPIAEPDSDTLDLTITSSAGGSFTGQLEPDYQDFSPNNGLFCGPTCSGTEIAVTLSR